MKRIDATHPAAIWAILMALLLGGCATDGSAPMTVEERLARELERLNLVRGEPVRSVSGFRIDGWHDIDDRYLILTAGLHDHYLVELAHSCIGLERAFTIGLSSPTSALTRLDSIIVRSLHDTIERCQIQEIYRLAHPPAEDR